MLILFLRWLRHRVNIDLPWPQKNTSPLAKKTDEDGVCARVCVCALRLDSHRGLIKSHVMFSRGGFSEDADKSQQYRKWWIWITKICSHADGFTSLLDIKSLQRNCGYICLDVSRLISKGDEWLKLYSNNEGNEPLVLQPLGWNCGRTRIVSGENGQKGRQGNSLQPSTGWFIHAEGNKFTLS